MVLAAQKYDYIWLTGYNNDLSQDGIEGVKLDFNAEQLEVTSIDLGASLDISGAVISDTTGNLLFYTDGCRIINKDHQVIENGDGINPGEVHNLKCDESQYGFGYTAGRQSSLILPHSTNDSLFYLFHKHIIYEYEPEFDVITDGLYYTLIDAYGNNGQGRVLEKNIPIIEEDLSYGEMTAVKHANGIDWWIVTAGLNVNTYYSILFDADTIRVDTIFDIGEPVSGGGQANFSPDGSKYASYNARLGLHLFDFNRNTGVLSNYQKFDIINESLSDGVAFSPNSRFLYASAQDTIFQYDIKAIDIEASREVVAIFDGFQDLFYTTFHNVQLAPDCKMYVNTFAFVEYLHVINNPDEKGEACNVEQHVIELPYYHSRAFPYFPNYRLGPLIEGEEPAPPCESIVSTQEEEAPIPTVLKAYVFPNPASDYIKVAALQELPDHGELLLFTQLGQEVFRGDLPKGEKEFRFEVGHLSTGLYFYVVTVGGKQVRSGKVLIRQ